MGLRQIPNVVCALGLLFGAGAAGLQAQSIHGRVLVVNDTVGIEGARVSVVDSAGTTLTAVVSDSTGGFNAFLDDPGGYRMVATRLGYRTSEAMILIQEEEIVDLEARMAEQAIPLAPILVVARRRIRGGDAGRVLRPHGPVQGQGHTHPLRGR